MRKIDRDFQPFRRERNSGGPGMSASVSDLARKAATGAGWMVFQRAATRGVGVISTLMLARLLLPGDFGLVALATTFAGIVDALGAIGLRFALIRIPQVDRDLYDTAFTITILRGIASAAIVAAGAP